MNEHVDLTADLRAAVETSAPDETFEALSADMFANTWDLDTKRYIVGSKRFGLQFAACRNNEIAHNANWLNIHGDKLGWGDLRGCDMDAIANGLQPGEVFLVAAERMFWDTAVSFKQTEVVVDRDTERHVSLETMIKHLRFVITPGQIRVVSDYDTPGTTVQSSQGRFDYGQTPVTYMSKAQATALIKDARKQASAPGVVSRVVAKITARTTN